MYQNFIKRSIDVILSFCGLIVLSPLYLIISILIFIDDPGPVIFTQKRVGKNKEYFMLHKFRSMKMSTPHDTPTHMLKNPEQYITKIGKFLRKSSLDEIPQIWDIFIGKMSIIGPRPALWNQYDLIEERDKYGANDILPGLTGWAQINGRDELDIKEKAKLDGEYVRNLNFSFDLKCFLDTIYSVIRHDGVLEGGTGKLIGSNEKAKKILITGKKSYIGLAIEKYLKSKNNLYEVDTLSLRNYDWENIDLSKYDVIVHVAGIAHQRETKENALLYYEINRDLTIKLAKKAKNEGVKHFIYFSSMSVYGKNTGIIDRNTKPNPISNYGKSKYEAEIALGKMISERFKVCIVRPPMVYGYNSPGNLTKLFNLVKKIHVFPTLLNKRSAININLLVEKIEYIIKNNLSGLCFPQDDEYMCTYSMVKSYAKENNIKVIYLSLFNPIIRFLFGKIGTIDKCFGDLFYDKENISFIEDIATN